MHYFIKDGLILIIAAILLYILNILTIWPSLLILIIGLIFIPVGFIFSSPRPIITFIGFILGIAFAVTYFIYSINKAPPDAEVPYLIFTIFYSIILLILSTIVFMGLTFFLKNNRSLKKEAN